MVLVLQVGRGGGGMMPSSGTVQIGYDAFRQAALRIIAGAQASLPPERRHDPEQVRKQLKRQASGR